MSGCHNPYTSKSAIIDTLKDLEQNQFTLEKRIETCEVLFPSLFEDINNLRRSLEAHSKSNKEIFDRLEKIEEWKALPTLDMYPLYKRVECLEKLINVTKTPHKCPVCKGHGKLGYPDVMQNNCHACDGKGIVWG